VRQWTFAHLVVPVYAVEDCLYQCLDSIRAGLTAEESATVEVIAVDDHSPDHCGDMLDAYGELRVLHLPAGKPGLGGRRQWPVRGTDIRRGAPYIDGIGPDKNQIIPRQADGSLGEPTALVRHAHAAGLVVHPYTFRAENTFLPTDLQVGTDPTAYGRAIDEQTIFLAAGIDGLFTDQADIGVLARTLFRAGTRTARRAAAGGGT
jgi:glycerophosphoryl diester phosphodiesterase